MVEAGVTVEMTIQQAYEKIRTHFSQPGAQYGYNEESGECQYRSPENHPCAVGVLIPDELYEQIGPWDIEGKGVRDLAKLDELRDLVNGDTPMGQFKLEFLTSVQRLHDNCAIEHHPMEEFIRRLDQRAREFYLLTS